MTQTLIPIGNSEGIILPQEVKKDLGVKKGDKIELVNTNAGYLLKKSGKSTGKKKSSKKEEFQKWLSIFLEENGDLLDELAIR